MRGGRRRWRAPARLAVALAALGCAPAEAPPRHAILISLDTARADHLGCYGSERVHTPHIDRLAGEAVLFRHASAAAPTTLAAHTSILTGRYPHHHGVARNGFRVHPDNELLAERLRAAGFRTAAFVGSYALHSSFGIDQGFEHFDERFELRALAGVHDQSQRRAEHVTRAALRFLDGVERDDRLFLFVHYFDPHAPFDPPPPYDQIYRRPGGARSADQRDLERSILAHQERVLGRSLGWPFVLERGLTRELVERGGGAPLGHDLDLAALYAGEISYTDKHVGALLTGLQQRGVLEHAVVVLTADHGESFWEHGDTWNHGLWVYQTTVRVPLIVRLPGAARGGSAVEAPVSSVDIAPTLLELLGLEPSAPLDGESLAPLLRGEPLPERSVFSEATQPRGAAFEAGSPWRNARKTRSVRRSAWKYIRSPYLEIEELYHLGRDPGETRNLLHAPDAEARAQRDALRAALDTWSAAAEPLPSGVDLRASPEVLEHLRRLGYLGGGAEPE